MTKSVSITEKAKVEKPTLEQKECQNTTVKVKKTTRFLKVKLTEQEVADAADRMADGFDQVGKVEEEAKQMADSYKAKLKELEGQLSKNQLLVRNKYDFRQVDCEEKSDYKVGKITITRLDTKETVEDRVMNADEQQMTFFEEDNEHNS